MLRLCFQHKTPLNSQPGDREGTGESALRIPLLSFSKIGNLFTGREKVFASNKNESYKTLEFTMKNKTQKIHACGSCVEGLLLPLYNLCLHVHAYGHLSMGCRLRVHSGGVGLLSPFC